MKTYEVLIKAYRVVLVEAEHEDKALQNISDEGLMHDFDWEVECASIDGVLETPQQIENAIRHGAKKLEDVI